MSARVDPALVALFGSENRALTLAALANSSLPLTGYRVARITGTQPIKVYAELRRLGKSGLVRESPTAGGRMGWTLEDPDVRSLLRRRARISWGEDWNREVGERILTRSRSPRLVGAIDLSKYRAEPERVPNRSEFERPTGKDAALSSEGLQVSRRRGRAR